MASQHATIDYTGLTQILDGFERMNRGGTPALIKASARLCAVQLALRTQPFSVGQSGKGKGYESGAARVKYDIEKVIRSDDKLQAITDHIENQKIRERMRKLIEAGDYGSIAKILVATRISLGFGSDIEILKNAASIKKVHSKHRDNKSGRTYAKTDKMYIASKSRLEAYIKTAVARVGRSKAGWADCARKINAVKGDGARGIPAWAKSASHSQNGLVDDETGNSEYRFVEMHNMVPWASSILSARDISAAQAFAKQNLVKSLQKAFSAVAKKHPDINQFIQSEVDATNEGE